jgi:hypothetical protein
MAPGEPSDLGSDFIDLQEEEACWFKISVPFECFA